MGLLAEEKYEPQTITLQQTKGDACTSQENWETVCKWSIIPFPTHKPNQKTHKV